MRIGIVTPAPPGSLKGNRVTALRWARRLRELRQRVEIVEDYSGEDYQLLIGLHLRHSAAAALRFHRRHPQRPLLMALTGTDIYGWRLVAGAGGVLRAASALIALQPLARRRLPAWARAKTRVIYQAAPAYRRLPPRRNSFDICVLSHLRAIKDPLLAAQAARSLPAGSRVRILHAGAALEPGLEAAAQAEMRRNPRYRWLGPLPPPRARVLLRRSRALVVSSLAEGGANVVSEALRAGIPVLATRIAGNLGLLGGDYAGYFPARHLRQLGRLLARVESEPQFLRRLQRQVRRLAPQFSPERERQAWQRLLRECS